MHQGAKKYAKRQCQARRQALRQHLPMSTNPHATAQHQAAPQRRKPTPPRSI